jgi:hypothetical protein
MGRNAKIFDLIVTTVAINVVKYCWHLSSRVVHSPDDPMLFVVHAVNTG